MSDNTARGFLDFILTHPDDDAPRLVFADWLEEQGESDRAEFIRIQIERARLPEWDARQVRLRLRERELLNEYRIKWTSELPDIDGITWGGFRRGFMATATFHNYTVLQDKAGDCWGAAPLESISIRWPDRRETVANIAPIAGLRELTFNYRVIDQGDVARLADAPLLATLRALNIRDASMGVEGFQRLLSSPHLESLTALRVPGNSIGNGGIRALFEAASLTSLEELDLSEVDNYGRYGEDPIIEAAGVEELLTWPGMTRMRSLRLSGNAVGRYGLRLLLLSPRATGLKELALRNNGLNDSGMQEFGSAHPELQLDVLDLGENWLDDEGAAELANAPCLRALKVLNLERCEIEVPAARRLAKASFLGSLRRLHVNDNSFGPDGLKAILQAKPQELHTLQMDNNDLGNEGVSHLAESPASDTLLEVDLRTNGLDFHALRALANSERLRNLLILRLNHNPIDKLDAATFPDTPLGKRLAVLEMPQRPQPPEQYVNDEDTSFGDNIPF